MDSKRSKALCCVVFLASWTLQAQSPKGSASREAQAVTIIELFTSEGCSSCPPADELLRQVNLTRTGSGSLVVGLSEHVTYWNRLGWRDPFSLEVFTERQTAYASRFSLDGPYTPQMVVNGERQLVGSDSNSLSQALKMSEPKEPVRLSILKATAGPEGVDLRFVIEPHLGEPLDIYAAVTDDLDRSSVLRGENSGRLLQHASVVRSFARVNSQNGGTDQTVRLSLPKDFDRSGKAGHHVVVFAQRPHEGAIVGAATMQLF